MFSDTNHLNAALLGFPLPEKNSANFIFFGKNGNPFLTSRLPLASFCYRKNQQKLSAASRLPLGGKVPSDSEANEGRGMLSQEESKDSEPREDLTSSVNSVDSFPEGEAEDFGEKATEGEAENKAEQSEVNGND